MQKPVVKDGSSSASGGALASPKSYAQFDAMDVEHASKQEVADADFFFLARACVVLGISGLIFGYDIGVISGALPVMSERFDLSPVEKGMVVSFLAAGSTCGGVLAGFICDRIGRKRTVHIQNAFFALGTLSIACAQSKEVVMFGRFMLGIGAAFSAVASLAYLCELAPLEIRGWVTSAYEMLVVTGILAAWVVDYGLARRESGWRFMFGGILVAIVTQTAGILHMPESPRWLLSRGDVAGCRKALRHSYRSDEATALAMLRLEEERRVASAADDAARAADGSPTASPEAGAAADAPAWRASAQAFGLWRQPLLLGMLLGVAMHFSGGVMVRNFAGEIFLHAGVSAQRGGQFLMYLGFAKFAVTAVSIVLVDVTGRRPLLLTGIGSMAVGMGVLAWAFRQPPSGAGLAPLFGCVLVIVGYSFSYGPLVWLLWAELFPTAQRGQMIGVVSFLANLAMFLNNLLFEPLADALGSLAPVFDAYTATNVASFFLFAALLPETKGAPPEATRESLRARLSCAGRCGGSRLAAPKHASSSTSPRGTVDAGDARARLSHGGDAESSTRELPGSGSPAEADYQAPSGTVGAPASASLL